MEANAFPRKRFFIEMFTRDISLADCILDLIDNSIDGLIKSNDIDLGQSLLLEHEELSEDEKNVLPLISVEYSDKKFTISDYCGGISLHDAINEVFNFGHQFEYHAENKNARLGVYGVGLKRAIFKLGKLFEMKSQTLNDGFSLSVDIDKWIEKDKDLNDWKFPVQEIPGAKSIKHAGTKITIGGAP